jgi:hypothetical protein
MGGLGTGLKSVSKEECLLLFSKEVKRAWESSVWGEFALRSKQERHKDQGDVFKGCGVCVLGVVSTYMCGSMQVMRRGMPETPLETSCDEKLWRYASAYI